jgi:rubredoxin
MTDRLRCPTCGCDEFRQERTMLYEELYLVQLGLDGEIDEEEIESSDCCGEDSAGAYQCKQCGWELVDEDGGPIINPEEVVAKFTLQPKQKDAK